MLHTGGGTDGKTKSQKKITLCQTLCSAQAKKLGSFGMEQLETLNRSDMPAIFGRVSVVSGVPFF
jgi:hypothetical protein